MNNNVRQAFVDIMRIVPDETYLKIMYYMYTKKKLDLKNPRSFNEKLQWLKLHDRNPRYTTMVDKFSAKEYVASIIGKEYIIPTIGVWDNFSEIDFASLPNQFVLKCTHDSGGLAICRDKESFDIDEAKKVIERSLRHNYYYYGREWPYKNVKPRIIAEQYMEEKGSRSLADYKFYCFNGVPKFLYLSSGLEDHSTARISYVSLDWTIEPFKRTDYKPFEELAPKPVHFDEMKSLAARLSKDIPFSRIDFYEINGKVYFGEITLFPGSGFTVFDPEEWDERIGDYLELPIK